MELRLIKLTDHRQSNICLNNGRPYRLEWTLSGSGTTVMTERPLSDHNGSTALCYLKVKLQLFIHTRRLQDSNRPQIRSRQDFLCKQLMQVKYRVLIEMLINVAVIQHLRQTHFMADDSGIAQWDRGTRVGSQGPAGRIPRIIVFFYNYWYALNHV